ncbi:MAG: undecaprenyl-diphosphate phosphatase [Gammaproteobacteria bacterium]
MELTELGFVHLTILALIQGLTEFLPISSSAHLILPSQLLGWPDQGLVFDVAVHLGTLLAVVCYFYRDLIAMLVAWLGSFVGRGDRTQARLAWMLIIATLPAGLAGLLLNDLVAEYGRSSLVIAAASIVFALGLYWADKQRRGTLALDSLGWREAIWIGLAQMLALIPGTSRSGVTMMAGLLCQLSREDAARFSFLLAIPIILASGGLQGLELATAQAEPIAWAQLLYGVVISALVAFACIHYFLQLIPRLGFLPFVIYRIVLGVVLLAVYWLS